MVYLSVIFAVLVADQLSKGWIVNNFDLYQVVEIIPGFFNLVYVTNPGAAFSILADFDSPWRHYFFLIVGTAAIIGLSVIHWQLRGSNRLYSLALGLIVGGAAGNLIDRVRFGAVVDFLDFSLGSFHWPAFNVADSAICIGAGLFIVVNFRQIKTEHRREN
ncbi:MAG: signal peptidase II [Desulforhopalus sp.]|jgi:signal peptidase II|nr:signal peptidase II [Desulforhopalus sp.]